MHAPLVTVITRTRDRTLFLARAVESVGAQTYRHVEHLVINDGGAASEVEALVAGRARVLHLPTARGMEAATNHGLDHARGTLVALLDDDDTWAPEFLEVMVTGWAARPAEARAVVCRTELVEERVDGQRVVELARRPWNPGLVAVSLAELAVRNLFTNNAFVFERAALEELGRYDERLPVYGDWDFNLRFFARFDAVIERRQLARYHKRTAAPGAGANSFDQDPALAEVARARLVNLWLRGDGGRPAAIAALLAAGPEVARARELSLRLDKYFNALHRLRSLPVARLVDDFFRGRPSRE